MTKAYLLIRAKHGKEGIVKTALSKYTEIYDIHEVFGRYDIVAYVETQNTEEFNRFIKNKIRVVEGIKSTEPLFISDDS